MRLKKAVRLIHLWVGLTAGFVVSIAGLTGAIYVFAPEIEARPFNRQIEETGALLAPEEIIARYEQEYGTRLHMFMNQRRAQKFYVIWLKDPKEEIFVDPYTGREIRHGDQGRSTFWTWLVGIHMDLGLGTVGRYINAVSSLLLAVVLIATGIYLWWPKTVRGVKRALTIKWNVSWKRMNHDLHNVGGWYLHLFIGLLAFTGACFTFSDLGPGLLNLFARNDVPEVATETMTAGAEIKTTANTPGNAGNAENAPGNAASENTRPQNEPVSFVQVAETASRLYPDLHLMHIVYDQEGSSPIVFTKTNHQWISSGKYIRTYTYLDPFTGEVVRRYDPRTASFGERITSFYKRQIHYGEIGGWITRILAFIAGMSLPALYVTGIIMWYHRTRGKKKKERTRRTLRRLARTRSLVLLPVILLTSGVKSHAQEIGQAREIAAQQLPRTGQAPRAGSVPEQNYFPPPDSLGGWRTLTSTEDIRRIAGLDRERLDEAFDFARTTTKNGGLLVVRHGYLVYERYFGMGQREATPNLASCGKAFTSIAVGMLMEERPDLFPQRLDQKIFTPVYFPEKAFPLSDPRMADIKLGQLLSFTAGIRGNNPVYVYGEPASIDPAGPDGWFALVDDYALGLREGTGDGHPFSTRTLWCAPGEGYSYATAAIHDASIMLRHITGAELEDYIAGHLAAPLGWGRWGYGYRNHELVTHTPGGAGIALRSTDMLRFCYLLLQEGRWNGKQLVPAWYVRHASRESRYNPHFPYSLQFNVNSGGAVSSLPRDAYWKPGSGGHCLYVVPSLDLIVWKLGGRDGQYSGGNTGLPEPPPLPGALPPLKADPEYAGKDDNITTLELVIRAITAPVTAIGIAGNTWTINGRPVLEGSAAEGLLMNVRMVNAIFEDDRPEGEKPHWDLDPEENTDRFIAQLPAYVARGVRAFTISLQGGFPGYEGAVNSAFNADGSLRKEYMGRAARVIRAADRNGAAIILSCFYQRQHSHDRALNGKAALLRAVGNVARWIRREGFTNVVLEISNEYKHGGYRHWKDGGWLMSAAGQVALIKHAKKIAPGLLVSTSGMGGGRIDPSVAKAADFILLHFNNTPAADIPARVGEARAYGKPVVCNEDDKTGPEGAQAARNAVRSGAGWGFMQLEKNQSLPFRFRGAADDPAVYRAFRRLTGKLPER